MCVLRCWPRVWPSCGSGLALGHAFQRLPHTPRDEDEARSNPGGWGGGGGLCRNSRRVLAGAWRSPRCSTPTWTPVPSTCRRTTRRCGLLPMGPLGPRRTLPGGPVGHVPAPPRMSWASANRSAADSPCVPCVPVVVVQRRTKGCGVGAGVVQAPLPPPPPRERGSRDRALTSRPFRAQQSGHKGAERKRVPPLIRPSSVVGIVLRDIHVGVPRTSLPPPPPPFPCGPLRGSCHGSHPQRGGSGKWA